MIFGKRQKEVRSYAKRFPENPESCVGCWAHIVEYNICRIAEAMHGIPYYHYSFYLKESSKSEEFPVPSNCSNGFKLGDPIEIKIIGEV